MGSSGAKLCLWAWWHLLVAYSTGKPTGRKDCHYGVGEDTHGIPYTGSQEEAIWVYNLQLGVRSPPL